MRKLKLSVSVHGRWSLTLWDNRRSFKQKRKIHGPTVSTSLKLSRHCKGMELLLVAREWGRNLPVHSAVFFFLCEYRSEGRQPFRSVQGCWSVIVETNIWANWRPVRGESTYRVCCLRMPVDAPSSCCCLWKLMLYPTIVLIFGKKDKLKVPHHQECPMRLGKFSRMRN